VRHPPDAGKASIRHCGQVLPNRRRRPLPLLSLGQRGPCVERVKRSAARGRTSGRPGTNTADERKVFSLLSATPTFVNILTEPNGSGNEEI
jgi:hypothetical protein